MALKFKRNVADKVNMPEETEKAAEAKTEEQKPAEEKAKKKAKKTGSDAWLQQNTRKIGVGFLIIAVMMVLAAFIEFKIMTIHPYAVTVDDNVLCYIDGSDSAEKTIDALLTSCAEEGSTVKAVDTGGRLKVEKAENIKVDKSEILSTEDAVNCIMEAAKGDEETGTQGFDITVASTKTEVKKYTPQPNYEKDDNMFAGQSEIKVEGVDGSQKVTTMYITVNGEEKNHEVTARLILDEGSPATIVKGTFGLPEGEDWKTYTGDPVFDGGDDLAKLAKKYLGTPYKYGGYSLTSGIDCVQFVRALYKKFGINLPNNHPGIRSSGVGVSLKNARPGDIVCYAPHHMAIYIGNSQVIHATRKGVRITSVYYTPSKKSIVTIRRIIR